MHEFYTRIQTVFKKAGSNRNQFCKKFGYNYQTLQAYWNTDRLPPGNVLEDLAQEYNVSLDTLVLGRRSQDATTENPVIARITRFLDQQDGDRLLQIEGALQMYDSLTSSGSPDSRDSDEGGLLVGSYEREDAGAMPVKLEKLTDLLTQLAQHIQKGNMSLQDKELSKELLNQIVLNVYEPEVDVQDEWATLEEID